MTSPSDPSTPENPPGSGNSVPPPVPPASGAPAPTPPLQPPAPPPPFVSPSPGPAPRAAPAGTDKIWALLSHLSGFIGLPFLLPLIVYLAMKDDSAYVAENAREALNFHISLLLYSIVAGLLVFVGIGIVLLILLWAAGLILAIVAAIRATGGECYRYPMTIRLVT